MLTNTLVVLTYTHTHAHTHTQIYTYISLLINFIKSKGLCVKFAKYLHRQLLYTHTYILYIYTYIDIYECIHTYVMRNDIFLMRHVI